MENLAERAWSPFGHVDIAVNNAGVFPPIQRAINIDESNARWILEVNLMVPGTAAPRSVGDSSNKAPPLISSTRDLRTASAWPTRRAKTRG